MAGAVARAAAQGTIHPLDTLKVQMQVGRNAGQTRGNIQCAGRGASFMSGQAASLAAGSGGVRGSAAAITSMQVWLPIKACLGLKPAMLGCPALAWSR